MYKYEYIIALGGNNLNMNAMEYADERGLIYVKSNSWKILICFLISSVSDTNSGASEKKLFFHVLSI